MENEALVIISVQKIEWNFFTTLFPRDGLSSRGSCHGARDVKTLLGMIGALSDPAP
jgi:hypothetical protein